MKLGRGRLFTGFKAKNPQPGDAWSLSVWECNIAKAYKTRVKTGLTNDQIVRKISYGIGLILYNKPVCAVKAALQFPLRYVVRLLNIARLRSGADLSGAGKIKAVVCKIHLNGVDT